MLLGMSLMLGTGIPAYAKTVDATVVEQGAKEEGYKEEIGETLKEGFRTLHSTMYLLIFA